MSHSDNSHLDETEIMARVPRDDDTIVMTPFIGQLMQASVRMTQGTTNALIGNLTYQEAEMRATLELVQERVTEIANRPYIANSYLYLEAIYPRQDDVKARMIHNGYNEKG